MRELFPGHIEAIVAAGEPEQPYIDAINAEASRLERRGFTVRPLERDGGKLIRRVVPMEADRIVNPPVVDNGYREAFDISPGSTPQLRRRAYLEQHPPIFGRD